VDVRQFGAGAESGELKFTEGYGGLNRVTFGQSGETVPVLPLDTIFQHRTPIVLNVDVEGFEPNVIAGAQRLLLDPALKALIMETNGMAAHYGLDENGMHQHLLGHGFSVFVYDPFTRNLRPLDGPTAPNTLYVRELPLMEERLTSARPFTIMGKVV
jgi:hypothetical protein